MISAENQQKYERMDADEKAKYLQLVEVTRVNVEKALKNAIWNESIRVWIQELRWWISTIISELMLYIANNDTVWFSLNPWTDLRHAVLWISKGLSGIEILFKTWKWFDENEKTTWSNWLKQVSDDEQYIIAKRILEKNLKRVAHHTYL